MLLRSLLAIILAAEVCKAIILGELTNRKLNPISIEFCQYVCKGLLGSLYYYSSCFSALGLRYWAIFLYVVLANTIYPSSGRKSSSVYFICYNSSL